MSRSQLRDIFGRRDDATPHVDTGLGELSLEMVHDFTDDGVFRLQRREQHLSAQLSPAL